VSGLPKKYPGVWQSLQPPSVTRYLPRSIYVVRETALPEDMTNVAKAIPASPSRKIMRDMALLLDDRVTIHSPGGIGQAQLKITVRCWLGTAPADKSPLRVKRRKPFAQRRCSALVRFAMALSAALPWMRTESAKGRRRSWALSSPCPTRSPRASRASAAF